MIVFWEVGNSIPMHKGGKTVADTGKGPGSPLIFRPDWGPGARKNFFWKTAPPPLSKGLDDRPRPLISRFGSGTELESPASPKMDLWWGIWTAFRPGEEGILTLIFQKLLSPGGLSRVMLKLRFDRYIKFRKSPRAWSYYTKITAEVIV